MAVSSGKKARKQRAEGTVPLTQAFPSIYPKTDAQAEYMRLIKEKDIVFAIGSAGSGKTFIATHYAAQQLYYRKISKLVITRPAVEAAGETLGFLPGDLLEKFQPYLVPYLETLNEMLGKAFVENMIKQGTIEPVPLAYMRGRSFDNALILFDEAENSNPMQMKLLLTRIGERCKVLVNGDIDQKDIHGISGLEDAAKRLAKIDEVGTIVFQDDDVIRSGLCRKIVKAYR